MSPRRARATSGRVGDDPATALREHLLDTAERLLAEHQVSQVTTRQIARAAGVSDGVLYNYFADKYELVVTALVQRYKRILTSFEERLPAAGTASVEANLAAYCQAAVGLVVQVLPTAMGLVSEPQLLHRFLATLHSEPFGLRRLHEPLVAYLRAEQELGRLGPCSPEAAASLVLGSAAILAVRSLFGEATSLDVPAQTCEIISTLIAGIGAAPRDSVPPSS